MAEIKRKAWRFLIEDDGPTATEYAVLLGVISVGVLSAMAGFGDRMDNIYAIITGTMPSGAAS